jgi:tetratricopeptide (TPR) repeat protein
LIKVTTELKTELKTNSNGTLLVIALNELNRPKAFSVLGILFLLFALAGCAGIQPLSPHTQSVLLQQKALELENVPFYPQEEFQCGPAALATVLNHAGKQVSPDELVPQVYLPERKGSLQTEMLAATRRQGLLAYTLEPNMEGLLSALNTGYPPLVLLNLSLPVYPMWHYAVVVGVDPQEFEITLRSGLNRREVMPIRTFLNLWERSSNWGFVVLNPEKKVPDFATADGWLLASLSLERTNSKAADKSYRTGLARWPKDAMLWFGLGNSQYSLGNYKEAEKSFQQAVKSNPNFSDAWNNLAEARFALKQKKGAIEAAKKAVELGGKNQSLYEQTLKRIVAS